MVSILLLFTFLHSTQVFAGATPVEEEKSSDRIFIEADPSDSIKKIADLKKSSQDLPSASVCEMRPENAPKLKENLEKTRDLLAKSSNILAELEYLPKDANVENNRQRKAEAASLNKNLSRIFEQQQLCLFRNQLHGYVTSALKSEHNKRMGEQLESVATCLEQFPEAGFEIRSMFADLFDSIFSYFSGKKELNSEDCALLKNTYSLWASSYEQENDLEKSKDSIPVYNSNNHNGSFYFWGLEQNRGRIPPEGLTVFHADTHTDMGHVHSHYWDHWSGQLLDLKETQVLLNSGKSIKAALLAKLEEKVTNPEEKKYLQERIEKDSEAELRSILDSNMRKTVHHIAQPLAAAQYTGTANGSFVMCMPPWSEELPRSKTKADEVAKPIEMEFVKRATGPVGFEIDCAKKPKGKWNLSCRRKLSPGDEIVGSSTFQVLDCNQEFRKRIGTNSQGEPIYEIDVKPGNGFAFQDFFKPEDRQKGFLLDIDLDVFVSEGKGSFVEPISWERTTSHEKKLGDHGSHSQNSESDPVVEVSTKELDLIQKRMDVFFENLKTAKAAGYLPKVITLADSTALKRALAPRKLGEDYNIDGIQAYTPDCLVFLVNYMTRKRLKEIYPNASFQ